ncbi:Microcystin degradation protein MlrC, contains DUF1485 domain [Novosphingobium mathurense]|uniref:Microcystin degradation protein MlrC, contains DUF1485 domain n=2 Tax=Novosphingobium mathurense TaxID=428990 RepID=A0A1U6IL46_9SPHN|nr:Microcystin degradation protein MlrC, contains DUF1485 domain [Novosphingobium mathurense]
MPSGLVAHDVFEQFWSDLSPILDQALAEGLDAIFLALHGAMATNLEDDIEGELLQRIRATPGAETLLIFGVFDFHATITPRMACLANGLLGYRENPHIDAHETAVQAAELLGHCFATGKRPKTVLAQVPIIWPPTGVATTDLPLRALEDRARELESNVPGVLAINVVGGYAFSDACNAGVSFSAIVDGDTQHAKASLAELAKMAWDLRSEGIPREWDIDAALEAVEADETGPALLVEPADNIGGGAPGDCTDVLRAMIAHDVQGAGLIIADAEAVSQLEGAAAGDIRTIALGGKGSRLDPGPVHLEVEFLRLSDGRFELEDRHSHAAGAFGVHVDMGPSAVVRHRGITILITSNKTPPFDLGQWRSQGIDPSQFRLIGIKAAVGHRRAYEPIAKASYTVKTRGPCASDLTTLPYRRLRRPIFPLDTGFVPTFESSGRNAQTRLLSPDSGRGSNSRASSERAR